MTRSIVVRPDFLLEVPDQPAHGLPTQYNRRLVQVLANVKTISLGGSEYYKPEMTGDKAVKIRVDSITGQNHSRAS